MLGGPASRRWFRVQALGTMIKGGAADRGDGGLCPGCQIRLASAALRQAQMLLAQGLDIKRAILAFWRSGDSGPVAGASAAPTSPIVVTTGTNMGASSAGRVSRPARAALRQANRCCGVMSCRRATSDTTAPGA